MKALKELNSLKDQIAQAKQEKAEKKGTLSEQMKALKACGVTTVKEGYREVKALEKKGAELEAKLESGIKKLRKSYEW